MGKNAKIFFWVMVIIAIALGFYYLSPDKSDSFGEKIVVNNTSTDKVLLDEPGFSFSLEYPKDFATSSIELGEGGKKIVIESSEPKKGFQITTIPFDESEPLTVERIKKDLPELVMNNVENTEVDGFQALSFNSMDDSLGKTFEVWFVAGANLYQIQTYEEFENSLTDILKTWKIK